jgi:biopolymer transport protein ExbD
MPLPRKQSQPPEIPLTSTADVAFLLLIFFLVAASTQNDRGKPLDLPNTVESKDQQKQQGLEVNLRATLIAVNDEMIQVGPDDLQKLHATLTRRLAGKTEPQQRVVVLLSESNIPYQRWSDVINVITAAGGIPAPQMEEESRGGRGGGNAGAAPAANEAAEGQPGGAEGGQP